jgi:transposase
MRLAEQLCWGQLRGIYIPDERIQDLRMLVRGKVRATRWVTKLTNEMGSLLRAWGYVGSRSLLSKRGVARLEEAELPPHSARVLALTRQLWELAQRIERELEQAVAEEAAADEQCQLLLSMPEVGPFTALLVRAEVGDIDRFQSGEQLASYAGLTPRVLQSGERCHYGKLTKRGNRWMRYALLLLANRIARGRGNSRLHRLYRRSCLRQHSNDAKVAVARKALILACHLLRRGERWEEHQKHVRAQQAA